MEDYLGKFLKQGDIANKHDLMFEDYRKYTRDREFGELLAMDRPDECTGPMEEFLIGFITDEMRDVFPQVAVEFLGKETFLQDPEKRSILNRMHRPVRSEHNLEDPWFYLILQMMTLCAQNGSTYSKELLLGLYKTYYKQEYNVLKRFKTLSMFDLENFIEIEALRRGFPKGAEEDPFDYFFADQVMGRMIIIGELMNIELDWSWNGLIDQSNQDVLHDHVFWKVMDCADHDESLLSSRIEDFKAASQYLSEHFPHVGWFFPDDIDTDVEDYQDPTELIAMCRHVIEKALDEQAVNSDLFMDDLRLNLRTSAANAVVSIRHFADPEKYGDKIIMFAVIRYLADVITELEMQREQEMLDALQLSYEDPVTDEVLLESGMDEELLRRFRQAEKNAAREDPQIQRILARAGDAVQRSSAGQSGSATAAKQKSSSASFGTTTSRASGSVSADTADSSGTDEEIIRQLREQLAQKDRQIEELRGKLREQRDLQEESRKREISLRTQMDEWKRDRQELIALRSFAHDLESEEPADTEPADEEMKAFLAGKKIIIIGGHENWIKKMKRLFPDWEYITRNEGLSLTGSVKSCDKIYFYTDICGHSLYYRFLALANEYHKSYAFLHGTNLDRVIKCIYDDLC